MPFRMDLPVITKGEKSAAATKLMAVMGLGVKTGETITFTIEGGDEEASAAAMEQFCKELGLQDAPDGVQIVVVVQHHLVDLKNGGIVLPR